MATWQKARVSWDGENVESFVGWVAVGRGWGGGEAVFFAEDEARRITVIQRALHETDPDGFTTFDGMPGDPAFSEVDEDGIMWPVLTDLVPSDDPDLAAETGWRLGEGWTWGVLEPLGPAVAL